MSRPFSKPVDHMKPEDEFLLKKRKYEVIASICTIPSVMHKLQLMWDTGTGQNFLLEDLLIPFLKSKITLVTTATTVHDANDKPLCIVGCLKLYIHVGRKTELLTFLVSEGPAFPAIIACDFCYRMIQCIYPRTRSIKLISGSTVPIVRHYHGQRPQNTQSS